MKAIWKALLGLLFACLLAACGGGGGSSDSQPGPGPGPGPGPEPIPGTSYQITYNYQENGGTSITKGPASAVGGTLVDLSPVAGKPGWDFVGWNIDKDATGPLLSYTMPERNLTLYAIYSKWLKATFQDYAGASMSSRMAVATMYNKATSAPVTLLAQNTYNDGSGTWTPAGWSSQTAADAAPIAGNSQTISADTTFYGLYQRNAYTLSYNANGGTPTPPSQSAGQQANSFAIAVRANPPVILAGAISKPNATFDGWALNSATGTKYAAGASIQISANTVMFATWKDNTPPPNPNRITLGMYYFGQWSPTVFNALNCATVDNWWGCIKPYPDRKPLLGWYDNNDVSIVNQQLAWMADYGIDFVSIAWYWRGKPDASEAPILTYLKTANKTRVPYTLMWANHDGYPKSHDDWDALVTHWLTKHIFDESGKPRQEYFYIDGKPAVFIFNGGELMPQSQASGFASVADMLNYARDKAKAKGLKGIYFVGGQITASAIPALSPLQSYGLDAITAYNYNGISQISYADFDRGYRGQWDSILANPALGNIPYFLPMSSGADESPWRNGVANNRMSTPDQFETHLRAGYAKITANMDKTKKFGMFCCWNEYGEGSIIEPTEHYGMENLQRIQNVFRK